MSSLATNAITESPRNQFGRYVLMTAAYNEEATIERTIKSIVSQAILPERWVIVSDGSSDRSDDIIQEYARRFSFIRYLRITRLPGRNFGSKVRALHSGVKLLTECQYAFIGNVDADVSLEPSYFQDLIAQFDRRPRLGIAGGFFFEEEAGEFKSRRGNHTYSVTHAAQLVRRECYEAIGGYAVLEFGGEDWHAETSARMNGWEIEAFPELKIFHHRHTGEGGNLLRYKFRQGRMDHSFGCDPLFEVLKCLLRLPDKPFFFGCVARLTGFAWSWAHRDPRLVSNEFMAFLRNEQKARVRSLFNIRGTLSSKRNPTVSSR
jgi:poly-beta-1,6-N-acetyl-D-glucosamine synthase